MDITLKNSQVLRYLGYKGQELSQDLQAKIALLSQQTKNVLAPKNVVGRFEILMEESGVKLVDTGLVLLGSDIKKHLEGCEECFIFCATVGGGVESLLRATQAISTADSLIVDAAATAAIEEYCDITEKSLRESLKSEGKFLTWRFSPGYGDFPFTQQPQILQLLQAQRYTGVVCAESCIMSPAKSVTAVMGIASSKPKNRKNSCETCQNKDNCNFSCR